MLIFVAIELLAFSKMQISIFIAHESSQYLGFKQIPYIEKFFFAFCIYINFSQKKIFLYINLDHNDYHQRKIACTLVYIQKKGNFAKHFYIQKFRQFSKSKTICVTVRLKWTAQFQHNT